MRRISILVVFCVILLLVESRRIVRVLNSEYNYQYLETDFELYLNNINDTDSSDDSTSFLRRNLFMNSLSGTGKDASLHKVTSLPGLKEPLDFNHYAGLLPLEGMASHNVFYWLIESPKDSLNKPLVIWLNGGPGCSSMDGLWLELGPFRLAEDKQTIKLNPYSWHLEANMLFIDQPVGTGFSFTKSKSGYAKNDDMINTQFYLFMKSFLALYPRYVHNEPPSMNAKTRPIFFTGESHAGHFIPTIVSYMLQKNANMLKAGLSKGDVIMDVRGIALGNPWIDPINQYNPAEYAHGLGLLTHGQVHKLKEQDHKCRKLLRHGTLNSNVCISMLDHVMDATSVPGHNRLLMYDVRKFLPNPTIFPPGHENLEAYFNRRDVRQALHVTETPHRFQECTDPPYFALAHQDGKGVMPEIRQILESGIEMLVFNGQYDLICNHLNIEAALDMFNWTGQGEWVRNRPGIWSVNKKPAGYIRKAQNLQSLLGILYVPILFHTHSHVSPL